MPATRDKSDDDAAVEQDHGGHVSHERTSNDVGNLPLGSHGRYLSDSEEILSHSHTLGKSVLGIFSSAFVLPK
jgi:hypothetical protein